MDTYYEKIQTQLLAAKPRCEQLIAQMQEAEITLQNPYHEFFNAYRLIVLQAWNFAQKLDADLLFKNISLKELRQINAEYYASLDPEKGYEKSLANPDYAHKLYGDKMGAFLSAAFSRAYSSRHFLLMGDYANMEITLQLYFRLLETVDTPDYDAWLSIYREETQKDFEFLSKASLADVFLPSRIIFIRSYVMQIWTTSATSTAMACTSMNTISRWRISCAIIRHRNWLQSLSFWLKAGWMALSAPKKTIARRSMPR